MLVISNPPSKQDKKILELLSKAPDIVKSTVRMSYNTNRRKHTPYFEDQPDQPAIKILTDIIKGAQEEMRMRLLNSRKAIRVQNPARTKEDVRAIDVDSTAPDTSSSADDMPGIDDIEALVKQSKGEKKINESDMTTAAARRSALTDKFKEVQQGTMGAPEDDCAPVSDSGEGNITAGAPITEGFDIVASEEDIALSVEEYSAKGINQHERAMTKRLPTHRAPTF